MLNVFFPFKQEKRPVVKNDESDPVIWLDRLSAIFRSVNPIIKNGEIHPCQEVVMEVSSYFYFNLLLFACDAPRLLRYIGIGTLNRYIGRIL